MMKLINPHLLMVLAGILLIVFAIIYLNKNRDKGVFPDKQRETVESITLMALEVKDQLNGKYKEKSFTINFRIGLACSPVVAVVIGKQKFTYDLLGNTVNIASRMEKNGLPEKIHCTHDFKEKLERIELDSNFTFIDHGNLNIKGK